MVKLMEPVVPLKKEKRPFGEVHTGIIAENTGEEIVLRSTDDVVGIISENPRAGLRIETIYFYKKDLSRLIDELRRLL